MLRANDGSEVSTGAVRLALHLASRCNAHLTVRHMAQTLPEYTMFNPGGVREAEQDGTA